MPRTIETFRERSLRLAELLDKPFAFVVGCQKSGTTWVQRLLDGHPEICSRGEAAFVPVLLPAIHAALETWNRHKRSSQPGAFEMADTLHVLRSAMGALIDRWDGAHRAKALVEKTPEHAQVGATLKLVLPQARMIHVIRNGLDVVVSGWHHNLRQDAAGFRQRFATQAAYAGYVAQHHWRPYIEQARQFGEEHPGDYLELRYEDLHAHPSREVRRLLAFLGVRVDARAVKACVDAGSFEKLSGGRRRGEEDRASFFRKGEVGDWRTHLAPEARRAFLDHAGDLMIQLGYAPAPRTSPAARLAALSPWD